MRSEVPCLINPSLPLILQVCHFLWVVQVRKVRTLALRSKPRTLESILRANGLDLGSRSRPRTWVFQFPMRERSEASTQGPKPKGHVPTTFCLKRHFFALRSSNFDLIVPTGLEFIFNMHTVALTEPGSHLSQSSIQSWLCPGPSGSLSCTCTDPLCSQGNPRYNTRHLQQQRGKKAIYTSN